MIATAKKKKKEEMQHMTVLNVAKWEKQTRWDWKQLRAGSERPQQLRDVNEVNVQNDRVYKFRRRTSSTGCHAVTTTQTDVAHTHSDLPAGDSKAPFFFFFILTLCSFG